MRKVKYIITLSADNLVVNGVQILSKPISAIIGRRAVSMGQYHLEVQHHEEGILLSRMLVIKAKTMVILG